MVKINGMKLLGLKIHQTLLSCIQKISFVTNVNANPLEYSDLNSFGE